MNWSKTKLIGETLREYLLCLSIILAGAWAWYTFSVIEKDNISPSPIIEVSLKTTLIGREKDNYIKSEVTLMNNGNDAVWIELISPSLALISIDFFGDTVNSSILSKQKYQAFYDNGMLSYRDVDRILISPKSKHKLVYLSNIPKTESKFIQVSFMATFRHAELQKNLKAQNYGSIFVFTAQASEYINLR